MKRELRAIVFLCFVMLFLGVIYSLLTSCTKTVKNALITHDTVVVVRTSTDSTDARQITRENEIKSKTDTVYKVQRDTIIKTVIRRDSVLVRDSVHVMAKGDTVYVYKERWRTRYVVSHDTVQTARRDTVRTSKTDTIYRERVDTVRILRYIDRADSVREAHIKNHETVKEKASWRWWHTATCIFWLLASILGGLWAYKRWGKD